MQFKYIAKTQDGRVQKNIIEARDEKEAAKNLLKQNLYVVDLKPSKSFAGVISLSPKVSLKEKIIFTKELSMMIKAGLPIVDALSALEDQTENKTFSQTIAKVLTDVRGGMSLSKALAKYPNIFPNLYIAITSSGEKSGKLDETLSSLAIQLQKDYDLITKVKSALSYPVVIVIALIGVLAAMMIFVIPQIKGIFSEMGATLPLTTRMLIALSDNMRRFWYLFLTAIIALVLGIRFWLKTKSGSEIWDKLKIKLPIFGTLVKKIYLARFSRTTATLIASGLPMLEVLATVKEVVGNKVYKQAFDIISKDVETGVALSTAIKKHKIFPTMISQMVSVGEKSGKIDFVLSELADFYDKEVAASTESLASMIEPILIILIGAGVGVAVASIIMPIYSLSSVI